MTKLLLLFLIPFGILLECIAESNQINPFKLQEEVRNKNFKFVITELESLNKNSIKNPAIEENLYNSLAILGQLGRSEEPLLLELKKQSNDSSITNLILGFHYLYRFWAVRGYGTIDTVSVSAIPQMKENIVKSLEYVESSIKKDPNLALSYLLAFECLGVMSEAKESLNGPLKSKTETEIFQKFLDLSPESFIGRVRYVRYQAPEWGGSYEKMKNVIDDTQKYFPKNPKLKSLYAMIEISKVKNQKGFDQKFEDLLISNPEYLQLPEFAYQLGWNYRKKKDLFNALKYYTIAKDLKPYYDLYNLEVLKLKGQLGDLNGMLDDISKLKKTYPDSSIIKSAELNYNEFASFYLVKDAWALNEEKSYDKSIAKLEEAEKMYDQNVDLFIAKSKAFIGLNQFDKALIELIKANKLAPDNFSVIQNIDWLLVKEKRFAEIIIYWTDYLKLKPNDGNALLERSGSFYHNHQLDLAQKDIIDSCANNNKTACDFKKNRGW